MVFGRNPGDGGGPFDPRHAVLIPFPVEFEAPQFTFANDTEVPVVIVIALDASTSMRKRSQAVVDFYNAFLEAQKQIPGSACLALVKFDRNIYKVFDPKPLATADQLTLEDYNVAGGTALNDVIIFTIAAIDRLCAAIRTQTGREPRVVFPIITDGDERSSRTFPGLNGARRALELLEERRTQGWSILFNTIGLPEEEARRLARNYGIRDADTSVIDGNAASMVAASVRLHRSTTSIRLDDKFE